MRKVPQGCDCSSSSLNGVTDAERFLNDAAVPEVLLMAQLMLKAPQGCDYSRSSLNGVGLPFLPPSV